MGVGVLDLNKPPEGEEMAQPVMLQKDNKPICLTRCFNMPFQVPSLWIITEFRLSLVYRQLGLPQCQLYPEHENYYQKNEWGLFLRYLWKHKMAAIARSGCCSFYILAPDEYPEVSYALVLYRMRKVPVSDDQEVGMSGEILNEPRSSAYVKTLDTLHTNKVSMNQSDDLKDLKKTMNSVPPHLECVEDTNVRHVGDSSGKNAYLNAKLLDTSHTNKVSFQITHKFDGVKDPQATMNSVPQDVSNEVSNKCHVGDGSSKRTQLNVIASDTRCTNRVPFQCTNQLDGLRDQQQTINSIRSQCEYIEDTANRYQAISPMVADGVKRNFVKTDPSYLKTLGQTHSGWIFGAIAELIDNSRDANATRLDISIDCLYSKKERDKIPVLSVIDDGQGMSHMDIVRMLSFGHKNPEGEDPNRIGRFGIGFKTGAMKLGKDVLVLTQNSRTRSVALLSQSYNKDNDNLEIPIITYCKQGQFMEVDTSIQSEECANVYLTAIKEFSPFNEYFIGEKLGLFGELGTGTQIYIWNLDKWGSDYTLEWHSKDDAANSSNSSRGDILIRSRRVRSRPGQISGKVPLDYSLHAYLDFIFLDPRMKIRIQGSMVKSRPLAKYLNKTAVVKGHVMNKPVQLTLGRSQLEWERMNCGIFLYWHGRLIEAYKRVGGMIHNADMGRGVIGVIDVTDIMHDGNGNAWVLNSKQGFQDCEVYVKLEEWLGSRTNEYWDENFDKLDLRRAGETYKPDYEWVQCNKCRKWRILSAGFDSDSLPTEWFCYMAPFRGKCETPEQQLAHGVITVSAKRSHYESDHMLNQHEENKRTTTRPNDITHRIRDSSTLMHGTAVQSISVKIENTSEGSGGQESSQTEEFVDRPTLKRLRRGPPRRCK